MKKTQITALITLATVLVNVVFLFSGVTTTVSCTVAGVGIEPAFAMPL